MTAKFLDENGLPSGYEKINEVSSLSEKNGKINIKKGIYVISKNGDISVVHERQKPEDTQMPLKNGRNFPGIQEMEKYRKIQINAKMVSWKEEEKT